MLSATLNKGIIKEVFCGGSVVRILIETILDEVLAVVAHVMPSIWIESDGIVYNSFSCLLVIFLKERREIIDDVVGKDTKSPDVYPEISNFFFENFRRDILKIR
jgi:hypothetical protein